MAVKIPRESVNKLLENKLREDLYLIPDNNIFNTNPTPLILYRSDDQHFYVPYYYYRNLIKQEVSKIDWFPSIDVKWVSSLRDEQEVIANECIDHIKEYGTDLLNIYTGAGKTRLASYLTCHYKVPTLVFIPLTVLIKSWLDTYTECTTCSIWVVGKKKPTNPPDVIVCMIERFNKIPQEWVDRIGFLILDEGHLLVTPERVKNLLGPTPAAILALTALVERENGMEVALYKIIGEHKTHRPNPKPLTVYKVNTKIKHKEVPGYKSGLDFKQFSYDQSICKERNDIAVDICRCNHDLKGLIFCRLKSHVQELTKLLTQNNIQAVSMMGNDKNYKDSSVLVSTLSKTSTGFDAAFVAVDYNGVSFQYIILMVDVRSASLLTQAIGRSREDECSVFYLIDENNVCKSHWREAQKVFKQRQVKIIELNNNIEDK